MNSFPNGIAHLVIYLWPILAIIIYKKFELRKAIVLLFLLPYLFLPKPTDRNVILDLPLLSKLDKYTAPALAVLLLLALFRQPRLHLPNYRLGLLLAIGCFVYPLMTALTNTDVLYYGPTSLTALTLKDAATEFRNALFLIFIPFSLGYYYLNSDDAHKLLIRLIFIFGMIYSVLIVYEVRMSPQLHRMTYGYHPHDWGQQIRMGGFRPMVYLGHGLLVSLFAVFTTICTYTLWKAKDPILRNKGAYVILWCCFIVVICKSFGAFTYAAFFFALVFFFGVKKQLLTAALIASLVLIYPFFRSFVPLADIVEFYRGIDEDRAASLIYRIDNEDILLEKAERRPLFGWGSWGRNRVYDPQTGKDVSTTDGAWILAFGITGWVGYLVRFGFVCYPIIRLYMIYKKGGRAQEISIYTIGIGLMLTILLIDQIPNASLNAFYFLVAGSLFGRLAVVEKYRKAYEDVSGSEKETIKSSPLVQ